MKFLKILLFCFLFLIGTPGFPAQDEIWNWESGSYVPGFRLIEEMDFSRFYPSLKTSEMDVRPIRIYLWYPAKETNETPMRLEEYVRMAADDFSPERNEQSTDLKAIPIPVQFLKGLAGDELDVLMKKRTRASRDASFAEGDFPLLILGQGLYYESPLSHVVLCEFLASHGYVIASCPLLGTQYHLVNLNEEDLETEIRDMEFIIGVVRKFPQVRADSLGAIGFDLGGMAGLILCMRHPDVNAFLSLDAGILFGHSSGLPNSHPSYNERNFTIPWMHITQARFIEYFRDRIGLPSLLDRKPYGDSFLLHAPTENHGEFSSYSMFGIRKAIPGYWGPWESNPHKIYREICRYTLCFFDAYLKGDQRMLSNLRERALTQHIKDKEFLLDYKQGQTAPPSMNELVRLIIEQGLNKAKPIIEEAKKSFANTTLIDENVLNWLGYHFLYWWGREEEALDVFKMNLFLFPESSNAYDSLGEAYINRGDIESAIRCYKKSLELNPENTNAAEQLKRLVKDRK